MLTDVKAFSGFSVDDIPAAKQFYGDTLGIPVEEANGMLTLLPGNEDGGKRPTLVYPKGDAHQPASFTILNFQVDDVDATVAELTERGVEFEKYDGMPQDEHGVMHDNGPTIAWFKDPAGNILSVIAAG